MKKFKILFLLLLSILVFAGCMEKDELVDQSSTYATEKNYEVDLDNDGKNESVSLIIEDEKAYFLVNESKFFLEHVDGTMVNRTYAIVDVDKSDDFLEVAIEEACPPFDDNIHFYRYDESSIVKIGNIVSSMQEDNAEYIIRGDKTAVAIVFSNIIEGVHYEDIYNLQDGILVHTDKEFYEYDTELESNVYEEVNLYKNQYANEVEDVIKAGDKIKILGEKDDWLKILFKDHIFWINGDDLTHFHPNYPDVKFEFDGIKFWS